MDQFANLALTTVATAPSPASSGTSFIVQAGFGALFPTPPFNIAVWPAFPTRSLASNTEFMRCTALSTDTFTVTRGVEGSSPVSVAIGFQVSQPITLKTISDIRALLVPTITHNTSATVTFNSTALSETVYNDSASTIASLAITLPTTTQVGQVVRYCTHGACTSVTVTGTVVVGPGITSLSADSAVAWMAINTTGSFIRI